ncbi:hypothetical protein BDW69DRAFT_117222 [Aspergillus filifer]
MRARSHGGRLIGLRSCIIRPSSRSPLVVVTTGGRVNRLMLATLTNRKPLPPQLVADVPEFLPWGTPYSPDEPLPVRPLPSPGRCILKGATSGEIAADDTWITQIAVKYTKFSNDRLNTILGTESITVTHLSVSASRADWHSDLTSTGEVESTKKTGCGGFHLEIDAMVNILNATGTMTATVDSLVYKQPANGT